MADVTNLFGVPDPGTTDELFMEQFDSFGDLPNHEGYQLGVGAYVRGDGLYEVTASGWVKMPQSVFSVTTTTALASLNPARNAFAVVTSSDGKRGPFFWNPNDVSVQVARDPLGGVYVPPTTDTTGASGAWQRADYSPGRGVRSGWFGAVGDYNINTATGTDNTTAIQATIDFVSWNNEKARFDAGWYLTGTLYGHGNRKASLILTSVSGTFVVGETVTGATSGATGVIAAIDGTELYFSSRNGTAWTEDETVTGGTSGATGTHDNDYNAVVGSPNFRYSDPTTLHPNYAAGFALEGANTTFNPLGNDEHGVPGTLFVHKDGQAAPLFSIAPHIGNKSQNLLMSDIGFYGGDSTTRVINLERVTRATVMERIYIKARAEVTIGAWIEACWRLSMNDWNVWGLGGANYTTHGKSVLVLGTGVIIRTRSGPVTVGGGAINQVILNNVNCSNFRRGLVLGYMDASGQGNVTGPILINGGGFQDHRFENWVFANSVRGVTVNGSHSEWAGHTGMLIFNGASDVTITGYTTLTADGDAYKPAGGGRGGYGSDLYPPVDGQGYCIAIGYLPPEYVATGVTAGADNIRIEDVWFPLAYRGIFVGSGANVGPVRLAGLRFSPHPLTGQTADGFGICVPGGTIPKYVMLHIPSISFSNNFGPGPVPGPEVIQNLDLNNNADLQFAGENAALIYVGDQEDISVTYRTKVHLANTNATTIKNITGGVRGQVVTFTWSNQNTSFGHNAGGSGNIRLPWASDYTPATNNASLTLVFDGTNWIDARMSNPFNTSYSAEETSVSAHGRQGIRFNNPVATSVDTITGGVTGQRIAVTFNNNNTTLVHGTGNLLLEGNVNYVGGSSLVRELVYNGTNWIDTLRPKTIVTDAVVVSDDQTTLSVAKIANVRLANTVATDLATLTGGVNGQQVTITFSNSNTTLKHGTGNLQLLSDADIVGQSSKVVLLVYNGTNWVDVRR